MPYIRVGVIVALLVLVIIFLVLRYTKFGRSLYAVGGSEQSAAMMGLDVKKTKLKAYVQDKIDVVPTFFLKRWVLALQSSCSGSGWALWSVLFFAIAIGCIILYLLAEGLSWRKGGFYGAIVALLLFAFSFASASRSKRLALHPHAAIVMSSAAPVKSSPDKGSKDIFVLHEGTQVTVRDSLGDYREVVIADGNKGWILNSAIEMID